MTLFAPASTADRQRATDFVGRVAQLDPASLVRLVSVGSDRSAGADACVQLWARAGFGVVASTTVAGVIRPDPLTVYATNLIAALAVARSETVDAGADAGDGWQTQLPPATGWTPVGHLPAADMARKVRAATDVAQQAVEYERAGELRAKTKATVPPAVLDQALMAVPTENALVPVSMRMLFALSGMGWLDGSGVPITVSVTATWLRLDAPQGVVARRRMADLPPDGHPAATPVE